MVLLSSPLAPKLIMTPIRVNPIAFSLCGVLYNSSRADDLELEHTLLKNAEAESYAVLAWSK